MTDVPAPPPARADPATAARADVLDATARAVAQARMLEQRLRQLADVLPSAEARAIATVEDALDALGAHSAAAFRVRGDGATLELVGAAHVPADLAESVRVVAPDAALPAAEAARTGRTCACASRDELLGRFPAMRATADRLGLQAVVAIPVHHLARLEGVVTFGFATPRRLTSLDRSLLRVFGARYARALHSAHHYFAEHDARAAESQARAVAEAEVRARGEIVAVVSHELRTPLQAILGYTELLRAGVGGELPAQQREYVERIAAGGTALLHVVENLLGFSAAQGARGPSHGLDVAPFDLRHVVAEVAALAEALAATKRLALRTELPDDAVPMTSDARRVRQVLTNLVGNAIKFTGRGEVVVAAGAPSADTVRLVVRDTGPGIAAGELPHLFDPFWRGARRPDGAAGTGLGLSIVRQLARQLGGEVTAASVVGEGSTFTVEVPAVAPAAD